MVRMSRGVVLDDTDTTVREEGTACHWAAHQIFTGHPVREGDVAPNGVAIDAEMLDAVEVYRAAIAAWPTDAVRYFEEPVHCAAIHPECGGTPDVFAWDAPSATLYVGDLKYGYRPVQAERNLQLMCYVAGVASRFAVFPRRVVLMICQPRGGGVRQAEHTPQDVHAVWEELRAAAELAVQPDAPLRINPGCAQCAGRHQCPALQTAALDVMDASMGGTPDHLPFPAAENELRLLQRARDIVDARISGLEQQVQHEMKRGAASRWFEMRPGQSRLKWREGSEQIVRAMARLMGVSIEKPAQLVTPTQAKKLLGENLVAMHAERQPGALKLAPFDASKWARKFEEGK